MTWPALRERLSRRHATSGSRRRDIAALLWATIFIAGFVLSYNLVHTPDGPQHWSADRITSWLSTRKPTQDARIALIYVTPDTLKSQPYVSPVDRGILAQLIHTVDEAGPAAIGIDFVFDRHSDTDKDKVLSDTIHDAKTPIVLGVVDQRSPASSFDRDWQSKFLQQAGYPRPRLYAGHLYFDEARSPFIITDHVVRAIAPAAAGVTYDRSFAQQLALAGGSTAPLKTDLISWLLPPADGTETFLTLSADTIAGDHPLVDPAQLKSLLANKFVIIGGNFDDRDQHLTPLSVSNDAQYPGASIHAQVLAQILDGRGLYAPGWLVEITIGALIMIGGFWIGCRKTAERYHGMIELGAALALWLVSVICFAALHFLFPFTLAFFWGMIGALAGYQSRRLAA